MEKGYESILKVLEDGETIIYKTDKNFKFGEKNNLIMGEKIFCISNFGKIFIADKNKRLKGIKVYTYNHREKNIKFKVLTKDNIIAINSREFTDVRAQSFIINMRIDDFVNIINKLDDNPFVIEWSKYAVKFNEGLYESATIDLEDKNIYINVGSNKVILRYEEVIDTKIFNNSLYIMTNNSTFYNISIHCFNEDKNNIISKINNYKNLNIENKAVYDEESDIDKTQIMTYTDIMQEISVEVKSIESDEQTISNYYKNEFASNESEGNYSINEMIKKTEEENKPNKEILANLYGTINNIHYKGKKVNISLYNEEIKIIDLDLNKEILDSLNNSLQIKIDGNNIIFKLNNELFLLEIKENLDNILLNKSINESMLIGYTDQKQPFILDLKKDVLELIQGENYTIGNLNIIDIADINLLNSQYNFDIIALTLKDSSTHKLSIERKNISKVIENIYKIKSINTLNSLDIQNLKNLYLNCKKDKLVTIIFSALNKIKFEIDNYYKSEEKNRKQLVRDIFMSFENMKSNCLLSSMYYLQGISCENSKELIQVKKDLKNLLYEISFRFNDLEKIFKSLNVFSQSKNIYYRKVSLNSDMNEILSNIGINAQNLTSKEIFIDMEIDDYKFDIIMSEMADEINDIVICYMPYYLKCIDDVFYKINELNFNINKQDYEEAIIKYFVSMQFKSKLDNKYRLKEILNIIKKYKVFEDNVAIDILNLVSLK